MDETASKQRYRREKLDDCIEEVQRKLQKRRIVFSYGLETIMTEVFQAGWTASEAWHEGQPSKAWRE